MLLVLFRVVDQRPYPGDTEGGTAVLAVEQGARDARLEIAVDTDAALSLFRRGAVVEARFEEHVEAAASGEAQSGEQAAVPQGDGDSGQTEGPSTDGQ